MTDISKIIGRIMRCEPFPIINIVDDYQMVRKRTEENKITHNYNIKREIDKEEIICREIEKLSKDGSRVVLFSSNTETLNNIFERLRSKYNLESQKGSMEQR